MKNIHKLVWAAFFLALGLILPFFTGQIPEIGNKLLPMHINGKVAKAYVDYYRGTLLALEDLKRQGYSVDLSVMDTERSAIKLSEIVQSEAFTEADLILGPIYAEKLKGVLPYAEEHNIPVVTPLSDINPESISSPVLFQMQADSKYKYEKYAHILDGSYEINIVYAPSNNEEYLAEIEGITSGLTDFTQKVFVHAQSGATNAAFNFYTYVFATITLIIALMFAKTEHKDDIAQHTKYIIKSTIVYIAITAVSLFGNSYFKVLAAANMDSALLYPLFQGSGLILSAIMARIFFKEKISVKKAIGMVLAFAALCMINL